MDKKLLKRLIALVLTGGVLLSSTGVYTALAAEETTTSEYTSALVESTDVATNETTEPSTTESTTSETTVAETTEKLTETTTQAAKKPETTTSLPIIEEEVTQKPADNKAVSWVGVDGTEADIGSQSNPYAVSSAAHLMAMNEIINDTGYSRKYFQLTADIDFTGITLDSAALQNQAKTGMAYSIVSVDPSLTSSNVFFVLNGNGKRITNVTMEANDLSSMSIFGYINSASVIENVQFSTIKITNSYGEAMAAGIILKNEGTVKDCIFTGIEVDTTASNTTAESFYPTDDSSIRVYTGTSACIVDNSGVFDCETNFDLSTKPAQASNIIVKTGRPYAGTLVAQNRGKVNKIRAYYIQVTGDSENSDYVGGLVGTNNTTRTSSSTGIYYAEITSFRTAGVTGADRIGGLVGYNTGRVQRSMVLDEFKTNEKATASNYTLLVYGGNSSGGIVGYNTGDVQLCSALDIGVYFADTKDDAIYGGIAGTTTYGIRNSVATGSTAGTGTGSDITRYVGGIVGVGDTSSSFSVENCYALVKILDSKAVLGAIVGFNGETAYKANRIRNVFYSSIISTRPSPVSYGAAGSSEGDLVFSKPYDNAYYRYLTSVQRNTVTANKSQFSFSGWGDASFNVVGGFTAPSRPTGSTFSGTTDSMTFSLGASGKNDKTSVYYGVDITLPSGVGNEATVLSAEPMEFGILNTEFGLVGNGTKNSPFEITVAAEFNLLAHAPAAHFKVTANTALSVDSSAYSATPATFWGSVDFNNVQLTYSLTTPMFKGIYGSRDDSLGNNNANTHLSSSSDDDDTASNLAYGVVKNANIVINSASMSNFFGNISNATVKNCSITFGTTVNTLNATEANSGLFAKAVYGNSYLYGCYVTPNNLIAYNTSYNAVSGFIGTVDAQCAIIDNCGADVNVLVGFAGASNCAVFIGNIKSLDGGYIQNCYASGGVATVRIGATTGSLGSNNYIFVGQTAKSSTQIYNCYYSPSYYYDGNGGVSEGIRSGSYRGTCKVWSFVQQNSGDGNIWNDITIKVSAAEDRVYLANLENIDKYDIGTYSGSASLNLSGHFTAKSSNSTNLTVSRMTWQSSRASVGYTFSGGANANANLLVTHNATGLVARLTVFNSSELAIDGDGYYLIQTPIDLYYLSENQAKLASNGEYMYTSETAKIKLNANIDMSGYTIQPIGKSNNYFKGEFVSGTDAEGKNYTISNLSFTSGGIHQSLFGYVEGAVIRGIQLDNANIDGTTYCAALVGQAINSATIENCKVTNSNISGTTGVGAILGGVSGTSGAVATIINGCTVENTTVVSKVEEGNTAYVGGIAGRIGSNSLADEATYAVITNCTVNNSDISSDGYGIGGIVGFAPNTNNTISECIVSATDVYSNGTNSVTTASLGGIVGAFGGSSIADCTVVDSTVTGDCAAGIVTRLVNVSNPSTISNCTVTNTSITSDNVAAGILSQISIYATHSCYGDKIIDNCKISADTTVKSLVAGGIVGSVQSFSDRVLTISNCTNLGNIETTGAKGSIYDTAGGIVGRFASSLSTSGITITGCLSQGTLTGSSVLGGIIGIHSGNAHTGANKLISNTHVTTKFAGKNIAVVKGLIIGYVGAGNQNSISALSENVVYSSLDLKVSLFGNVAATAEQAGAYDMNLGSDQSSGITVGLTKAVTQAAQKNRFYAYYLHAIAGDPETALGKNTIVLNTNYYYRSTEYTDDAGLIAYQKAFSYVYDGTTSSVTSGAALSAATYLPRFSVDNLPVLEGTDFKIPDTNVFKTDTKAEKLEVGATATLTGGYNKTTDLTIQTHGKKCQATVYTTYSGTVNGEAVTYKVGFTVIVNGEHAFDGSGTESDPFIIREAADLLSIKQHRDKPTAKDEHLADPEYYYAEGTFYEVADNIDMSEELAEQGMSFAPIGTADDPFKAHISSTEGEKFTISNMLIDALSGSVSYAYSNYYAEDAYSDALGVFGYTDGAEISNLRFENVEITSNAGSANGFLGVKTGAVVGQAQNTQISNVDVTGAVNIEIGGSTGPNGGAVGGIVGVAKNAVILSDVSVTGGDNRASIKSLYMTGGIVGSSADSTGGSITNARVENVDVDNQSTSGTGIAGGIAGQYSGTITGSYIEETIVEEVNGEEVTKTVITRKPVVVNNVSVTAIVAGGVVGSGNINNLVSGGCDLTIECVDVTNTTVEVNSDVIGNTISVANGIAGGILGTTHDSYNYLIEDCTLDSNTSVTSGYCAGGIVGRANNRGVGTLQSETSLFIRSCSTYAAVNQLNAPTTKSLSVSDDTKRSTGAGSIIGVISTNAFVMKQTDNTPQIQVSDCTAGGNISGTFNVGGIIGQFACTQYKLNEASESFVSNCIITAQFTALKDATERFGVILGSVEGNTYNPNNPNVQVPAQSVPFPEADENSKVIEYAVKPFDKIFYSSYTTDDYNLYGLSEIQNYQDPVYSVFFSTIYDVNQVNFNFKSGTTTTKVPISVVTMGSIDDPENTVKEYFGDDKYVFSDNFNALLEANDGSGTPFGFTLAGEEFTLLDLADGGLSSSDIKVFEIVENTNTNPAFDPDYAKHPYQLIVHDYSTADLVFTYSNGMQIAIPVICGVNYDGEGTVEDPIQVENEDIFYFIVKALPYYSFVQTADLDFTDKSKYLATDVAHLISNFTGTYDGGNHKISGLTVNIESAESPVGIFGNVSGVKTDAEGNAIPNVKDLIFDNCTINSGTTDAGTGVFAGSVTNGATVQNITVQNSKVTSSTGPVGGAVGIISGASTVDDIKVVDTAVTTQAGSAGGIVGTMTDDAATISAPKVENATITSGTVNADGTFAGSATTDIAGGIVAQAIGTIEGAPAVDEEGNVIENTYADAVSATTVKAFISGGAVGAVYVSNTEQEFNLNNVRVTGTEVVAAATDTTRTAMSAAGLLGIARGNTILTLNNSYVDKSCKVTSQHYAGGAIAHVQEGLVSLDIIDTETYAKVKAAQPKANSNVYAGGIIGYIRAIQNTPLDLNIITMNGCVAGGEIEAEGFETYAGGAIGGFNTQYITEQIVDEFFVNGVLSATVKNSTGAIQDASGTVQDATHRYGKFIAGYDEADPTPIFTEDYFSTAFSGNYYSSYPQNYQFFASGDGKSSVIDKYQTFTEKEFEDINVAGNLVVSTDREGWNNVAITGEKGSETILYAKVNKTELNYGNGKVSTIDREEFSIGGADGDSCITLVGDATGPDGDGVYSFTVRPTDYGAEDLGATYSCGLATTVPILCVEIKGTGTEIDPFLIENALQLRVVGYLTTGNRYFRQVKDIDLSDSYNEQGTDENKIINYNGGKGFEPIGKESAPFDGVYDGQGYKITGMFINRADSDNVGLFGVVKLNGTVEPTIMNVHLELMPEDGAENKANGIVGKNNVGGIAGYAESARIENCSVAVGSVNGSDTVGGIVGDFVNSKVINCFTQSDVNAFGASASKAGGIVGVVSNGSNGAEISGCFASGSIYATPNTTGTDISNAAGIVSFIQEANDITIKNCLFTGTTASGHGILGYTALFNMSGIKVSSCIDAGQNVAMAVAERFDKIRRAVSSETLSGVTFTNVYYDNALLKVDTNTYPDSATGFTGLPTSELINAKSKEGISTDEWDVIEKYYPVPVVSEISVTTYDNAGNATTADPVKDPYSQAYARFLSAPVQVSEKEECNDITDTSDYGYGKGLIYPVTLLTNIDNEKVTYSSSVFDTTDTVAYPEGFDTHLYGIGDNKNVDLLFEDKADGYTSVYRNIFDTTINLVSKTETDTAITKNTRVNAGAASGTVFKNGEAYYNAQVPVIHATAEIGGITVQREIKVPLSYGTTYCVATQRQLYALGRAENEMSQPNSKFSGYYSPTYNYKLITDIDCGNNEMLFTPIGSGTDAGYTGQFDGSGHTIKNLKISSTGNYVGMFSKVSYDYSRNVDPFIKNLTLENATVEGASYVGTLVGHVFGTNVTIENCHAIGHTEVDEDGKIIETIGTVTGTGSYVGGLIGKVDFPSDIISKSSASVTVYGNQDSVGGLIGDSSGTITSCYATGNVICNELTNQDVSGVGGLIGIMSNGTVTESFASGNVEVKTFRTITSAKYGVGGFVGYVAEQKDPSTGADITSEVITECFSGGNVSVGTDGNKPSLAVIYTNTGIVGVGGFSGINYEAIENCYSSAAVNATFGKISNNPSYPNTTYGVGVGGVCGVALGNVSDIYSSGSVAPAYDELDNSTGSCHYGVGGTIGTTMATNGTYEYCYFDSWTNSVPDLKSIGDREDSSAKSFTTPQLTSGSKPSDSTWSDVWGFTTGAYPYLKSLLNEEVDNYIKTNSILSVVCVEVDDDDTSVRNNKGITMALTVPTTFTYTTSDGELKSYGLHWEGATLEGNLAAINRTKNVAESLDVIAQVVGYEEYATRTYKRLCADMKGTYAQPYLIGNEKDLAHVNMTSDELAVAKLSHNGFYDQWATPIDDGGNQVQGTVYYQLMSNINVTGEACEDCEAHKGEEYKDITLDALNISEGSDKYQYEVTVYDEDGSVKSEIKDFDYQGFVFNGNAYAIRNVSTTGTYFANLDENSKLTNMIFENLTFADGSGSALVGTNNGEIYDVYVKSTVGDGEKAVENAAGLVLTNNGLIDGCVVDITLKGAAKDIGVMARTNNGIIKNSGTAGTIVTHNTVSNIGAFVADNKGTITSSFSMADVDVITPENASVINLSGFAAKNSGTINGVYTRSAISFADAPAATQTVASLVATLEGGTVSNSYAAGLLGYYFYGDENVKNDDQHSIAFGTVSAEDSVIENIYVDKSLAGQASYNSFKYAASTSSIMSMQYMADGMEYDEMATTEDKGLFIAGEESTMTFPQLAAILKAENTKIIDEETDEPIEIANGTIIRNYDVIKAYSKLSSMVLKTAQSQYVDRLVANSSQLGLNSAISTVEGIRWAPVSNKNIVGTINSTHRLETYGIDGAETIKAAYTEAVELSRGTKISPELLIDVAVTAEPKFNPNFEAGIGTKDNPYIIDNADSLQSLTYYGSDSTLYFALGKDIHMSELSQDFEQIPVFAAHLNEDNAYQYAITGLESTDGGLFGLADNAVINNVALAGAEITSSDVYTGALADKVNGGTITNCVVAANVTSSSTDTSAATGVLAGIVYGDAKISSIITTGNATATAGVAGGVIGSAEGATMSEFVSTANVTSSANVKAGGIVGSMTGDSTVTTTLANAFYGGVSKNLVTDGNGVTSNSSVPFVAELNGNATVSTVYYDNQLNSGVDESISYNADAGFSTKNSALVFRNDSTNFYTFADGGYYPIPASIAKSLETTVSSSYAATAVFAVTPLIFYKGSNRGGVGNYSSMQIVDSLDDVVTKKTNGISYDINVTQNAEEDFFDISHSTETGIWAVSVKKFDKESDPTVTITLSNGAVRTINPGLVKTVKVSYTMSTSDAEIFNSTKTLGILIKSVEDEKAKKVEVLNDFISVNEIKSKVYESAVNAPLDKLILPDSANGFYVGEILPTGYEYVITAKLVDPDNENNFIDLETLTHSGVYGTFVSFDYESEGNDNKTTEEYDVRLTLEVVKSTEETPWGVRSRASNIW